ncbi:HIT family protein [Reinekea marinisedimentorum]|uniref:Histidine triad (HIT) family protein n=1 Tax=Reinekea marinisedimentorum TaxID=230495 RepID=A0A4R3HS58_9GAMM|nr:HIT domain-containing protein [Reinekea marinisedimentorum]TCS34394.1 histidine triad (HIT) family protein [Reinekea marinisedimentorum]
MDSLTLAPSFRVTGISMHEPENYTCPFCRLLNDKVESNAEVIFESEHSVGFLGLHGNEGSGPTVLVASKEHYENLYDLPSEVLADTFLLAKKIAIALNQEFEVDGTTILQHNEPAGNQDVWHFHLHVKGRLKGDSLYKKTAFKLTSNEKDDIRQRLRRYQ